MEVVVQLGPKEYLRIQPIMIQERCLLVNICVVHRINRRSPIVAMIFVVLQERRNGLIMKVAVRGVVQKTILWMVIVVIVE